MVTNSPSNSPAKQREYRERFAAKPKVHVEEKTCLTCGNTKPRADFSQMAASKDGLQSYCKSCNADRNTTRRLASYGLTPESFQALIDAQGGVCPVCNEPPVQQGTVLWAIDHDHACCPGQQGCEKCLRGLLCNPCNRALGLLRDDPDVALNAATYLLSTRNLIGAWS